MTLQVRQIRKEFITRSGSLPVLCGIDLDLDSDKSLAIMGQSGSGKSTFLHVLGGLDKPSAGKILLDGLDPLAMNETDLAHYRNQKVGFVFRRKIQKLESKSGSTSPIIHGINLS